MVDFSPVHYCKLKYELKIDGHTVGSLQNLVILKFVCSYKVNCPWFSEVFSL